MKNIFKRYVYYSLDMPMDRCMNRIAHRFCRDIKYKGTVTENSFLFRKKEFDDYLSYRLRDRTFYSAYGRFIPGQGKYCLEVSFTYYFNLFLIGLLLIGAVILSVRRFLTGYSLFDAVHLIFL